MNSPTTPSQVVKVMLVGPIPPPYGGIPFYVKTLFESGITNIDFYLFNTAMPAWIAPINREGKRSYASIFENGFWVGIKKCCFVLFSFASLAFSILRERPQIVQVFTSSYWGYWRNWIYLLISRMLGRRTIFHLLNAIDIFYSDSGSIQRYWLRRSLNSADYYLVQSPELMGWVKKISKSEVISIWNGIDFRQIPLKKAPPPSFIASSVRPVGITIGALGRNKGTAELIIALQRLKVEHINLGWVFVGDGDSAYYKSMAESKGVAENIYFTGPVQEFEKWHYLHHADIFCLPSYAEGQPISILEAMAVGLPIISTAVGSIPEVVRDGIDGYIIQPVNIDSLVSRIKELLQNSEKRHFMGQNAQRIALERHNIQSMFENMDNVYHQMVAVNDSN